MKQRMLNVFSRKLKNRTLANALTKIGYWGLMCVYVIIRLFLKGRTSITIEEAIATLYSASEKPDMEYQIENKVITKDLSIIVPAYNAEKTIEQCVDSVLRQNIQYDYELLVINDGSTDSTKEILDKNKDSHLIVINEENRGFSGARNRGIDECKGKYIMFLDSDDYLVGNCIERMMDKIVGENADIVQAGYFSFVEEDGNKQEVLFKNTIIENDISAIVSNPGYPWAKIYKRELFERIRFPLNVWFEDTIVCMLLYRMCKKMVTMRDIVYGYRINPKGITKKARYSDKCLDHYWVMEHVLEKANELGLPKDDVQYGLVGNHMSTLLYRRLSLRDDKVIESAFIAACEMLDKIRPQNYVVKGSFINRDIERAFQTRNYKLWKLASFVV